MVVVSWNCAGAFRKKFIALENLVPDVCVIQECEAFLPNDWLSTSTIQIGTPETWLEFSDHMPVRIEISASNCAKHVAVGS
jgi:hypothetical protein